jgi:hypothetical protein
MRAMLISFVGFALFVSASQSLRAQDDLRAVIDKAIKAHGGAEKIDKHKAGQVKSKGTVDVNGMTIGYTEEATYHLPNKFKSLQQLDINGMAVKVLIGYNGTKAWINVNGMDVDMMLDKIADLMKEQAYLSEVTRLTVLKNKDYELSSLGESKVQDKPAVGVRVSRKGHKDINLFFDKDSGLLLKFEHRTTDFTTMVEVNEERIITEYQDKDGLKEPKKAVVNRDGKKYIDVEVVEVKYLDDIDDTQFSKP